MFSKFLSAGSVIIFAAALAACGGGGGGGGGGVSTPEPVSAPVPSAQADLATVELNKPAILSVLANDSITSGGKLTLSSVSSPANGTAVINGNTVVYTPAVGFFGQDSFSYVVKDAGSGVATATAAVAVTVNATLVFSGRAVDLPPSAAITIAAGSKTVGATTDATGNFSAAMALDTPASMITITAQGTGAAAYMKLISLVGDSQHAVTTAGSDATLTPAKLPGLLVTNISTSMYANAILRNSGAVPATQQALEQAASGVTFWELLQSATVLRTLTGQTGTAPTRALPAGVADTLAFVTNRAMYTDYVRLLPSVSANLEIEALGDDTNLSSIPAIPVNAPRSLVLHDNILNGARGSYELVFNADGSGSFARDRRRWRGTWNAGTMTLQLATPEVREDSLQLPDLRYIDVAYTTHQVSMRRYTGTDKHGFISLTFTGFASYPNGERPNGAYTRSEIWAFDDWNSAVAPPNLSNAVLAGLPDQTLTPNLFGGQMIVTLGADGNAGSLQHLAKLAGWKIENGKLSIDVTGIQSDLSPSLSTGNLTLGRVRIDAGGAERWLVRGTYEGDYEMFNAIVVRPQAGLSFTESNAVMSLTSSFGSNNISTRSIFTVRADRTGSVERLEADATTRRVLDSTTWAIEGGNLVMRSYRVPGSTAAVASCPAGVSCVVGSERIWTLLQSDDKSITVFESYRASPRGLVRRTVLRMGRN